MDDVGVERAAVVCQSMGGWTGMQFTLANPGRVSCLVLSGTPGGVETPAVVRAREARARGRTIDLDRPHRMERAASGARSRRLRQEPGNGIPLPPDVRSEPAHRRYRHRRDRRAARLPIGLLHPDPHGRGRTGPHLPPRRPQRSLAGHPRRATCTSSTKPVTLPTSRPPPSSTPS